MSEAGFEGGRNLHLRDGSSARVVVVSHGGGLVREFGRRSDGPGERGSAGAVARGAHAPWGFAHLLSACRRAAPSLFVLSCHLLGDGAFNELCGEER